MTRFTIRSSRRRHAIPLLALLLVLAGALVALAAAPPNVDTFENVPTPNPITATTATPASNVVSDGGAGNILGQERETYAQVTGGGGSLTIEYKSILVPTVTVMSISTSDFTTGTTTLTYDGITNSNPNPSSVDPVGLGGLNLTQSNTANGFRFNVTSDDTLGDLKVKVWSNASNWSERSFSNFFPGNFPVGPARFLYVEFPTIKNGTCAGGPGTNCSDFGNVGAVQFQISGPALDMSINNIDIVSFDWGDLPENASTCLTGGLTSTYATKAACEGPRHVTSNNLYLGAGVDPAPITSPNDYTQGEQDGQQSPNATGDDFADSPDDEDGVEPYSWNDTTNCTSNVPSPVWKEGTGGGRVKVTLFGRGRLVGWIDFNRNGFHPGTFTPFVLSEAVINEVVGTAGTTTTICRTFDVQTGAIQLPSVPLYARFRFFPEGELTDDQARFAFDGRGGFGTTINPQSKNGEVEDYVWYFTPTAVDLSAFFAEQMGDYVQVTWETASELDNRGFNLYRGTSPDEPDRQLNTTLIPSQSQGSTGGFTYTWDDHADLVPGTTYYYWLDDVDISGVVTRHGPVSMDFIVPTAVTLGGVSATPAAAVGLSWQWIVAGAGVALGLSRWRRRV